MLALAACTDADRTDSVTSTAQVTCSAATITTPQATTAPAPDPLLDVRDAEGRTPLVAATKAGDVEAARRLILAGADVNAKDNLSDSAFLYAGAEDIDEILELTLDHGADVRSLNRYGGTALIPATENGHPSTVQLLIVAGVPVDHLNSGWTALLEAVVYGDGSPRYQDVVGRGGATAGGRRRPGHPWRSRSDRDPGRAIGGADRDRAASGRMTGSKRPSLPVPSRLVLTYSERHGRAGAGSTRGDRRRT